jgi:hypothetical protein
MNPNARGGGELRGLSQRVQLYTGAQISFGDLTPYLTYGLEVRALLARQMFFTTPHRTVHFLSSIYLYRMHSMLVILPRLKSTQAATRLHRRPPLPV